MSRLTNLRSRLEAANGVIADQDKKLKGSAETEKNRAVRKAQREFDRKKDNVQAKYLEQLRESTEKANELRSEALKDYSRIASGAILHGLEEDYKVMLERSAHIEELSFLSTLSPQVRERATKLYELMKTAKPEQRDIAQKFFALEDENTRKAVAALDKDIAKPADVYSYIAASNKSGKCYVISPVKGGYKESDIVEGLELKLLDVALSFEIVLGCESTEGKSGVEVAKTHRIKFDSDNKFQNGFSLYVITPRNPENAECLARALTEKLEKLQPKGFKEAGLTHKFEVIDEPCVAEYFANNQVSGLDYEEVTKYSYDEAAKLSGKSASVIKQLASKRKLILAGEGYVDAQSLRDYIVKKARRKVVEVAKENIEEREVQDRLNFQSQDMEHRRTEAFARLNGYSGKNQLNASELVHVLGLKNPGSAWSYRKRIKSAKTNDPSSQNKYVIVYDIGALREFIRQTSPSRRGWRN